MTLLSLWWMMTMQPHEYTPQDFHPEQTPVGYAERRAHWDEAAQVEGEE